MKKIRHSLQNRWNRNAPVAFAIALSLGILPGLMAQDLTVPVTPPTTPAEADALSERLYSGQNEGSPEPVENGERMPWKLTPRVTFSAESDSNIFISPQNKQSDFLFTVSPGATFGLGDFEDQHENFFLLDYSASVIRFADHTSENAVEQQASLDTQYRLAALTVGLQFRFQDLAGPDVDVGERTKRRIYQTAFLTRYEISDKTWLQTNFYNNIFDYVTQLSSTLWSIRSSINYKWTPKITAGIGGALGQLNVERSGMQTFERTFTEVTYEASEKLSFECDGGLEIRQFGNSPERINPVFNIAGTYRPFEATEVKLDAYRRVENSVSFAGQDYTLTGVDVEIHRDILERFRLAFAAGYQTAAYHNDTAVNAGNQESRTDRYYYIRPSVQLNFREHCYTELFCQFRQNDSTLARYGFNEVQAGFQITYTF